MINKKLHFALSFLLLFASAFSLSATANTLHSFSDLSVGDHVVGELEIKTPNNQPYRIYEADIQISLLNSSNPCAGLITFPAGIIAPNDNAKIDVVSYTYAITSEALKKIPNGLTPTCVKVITYHGKNHTGKVESNAVAIPQNTMQHGANDEFVLKLNYKTE